MRVHLFDRTSSNYKKKKYLKRENCPGKNNGIQEPRYLPANQSKPFILPQKDPLFYDTYLWNYNIPEFINGKVDLKPNQIRNILYKDGKDVVFDEEVDVDALIYTQRKKKD